VFTGVAPIGYRYRKNQPFEVDRLEARKVREASELRASGAPFSVIARRFGWAVHLPCGSVLAKPLGSRGALAGVHCGAPHEMPSPARAVSLSLVPLLADPPGGRPRLAPSERLCEPSSWGFKGRGAPADCLPLSEKAPTELTRSFVVRR
jgi:hypothetical protein